MIQTTMTKTTQHIFTELNTIFTRFETEKASSKSLQYLQKEFLALMPEIQLFTKTPRIYRTVLDADEA